MKNLFIIENNLQLSDAKKKKKKNRILHQLDTFNCFKNIPLNYTDVHYLNNVALEIT